MFMEGITRQFTPRESSIIENLLVDAYNDVSGICDDLYQRHMLSAKLTEQVYYPQLSGSEHVLVSLVGFFFDAKAILLKYFDTNCELLFLIAICLGNYFQWLHQV